MGALHAGHCQLIKTAQQLSSAQDISVLISIFVNPLQFGPNEDLENYPKDLNKDIAIAKEAGANAIWCPAFEDIFPRPESFEQTIHIPSKLKKNLCGASRPGHFEGVITVMTRLLKLVQPKVLILGEKDWQQLIIIRNLVNKLKLPIQVKGVATLRDPEGLAYSSRNQYLSNYQKSIALKLPRILKEAENNYKKNQKIDTNKIRSDLTKNGLKVEYLEVVDPFLLESTKPSNKLTLLAAAVKCGETRLIDHTFLMNRKPIVAIDGPAGAGKSTVTKAFASKLGLIYLDTGGMYRAVTWLIQKENINFKDSTKIEELLSTISLDILNSKNGDQKFIINNQDVTELIRSPKVTEKVSEIATLALVRETLTKQQKLMGSRGGLVAEGRDIGTAVYPDADLKIFLTASAKERAKRRQVDLRNRGYEVPSLKKLQMQIQERDRLDSTRDISPLIKAKDATEIITDGMVIEEVVNTIIDQFRLRIPEEAWPTISH